MSEEQGEQVEEERAVADDAVEASDASEESSEEELFSAQIREERVARFSESERQALVEALLYASGEPLTAKKIADACLLPKKEVLEILDSLSMRLSLEESGVELFSVGEKFQIRTKATFAPFIQQLRAARPKRLSQQALETLAIVAYRQPIVRADVEKIRGVDATPTLKTLIDRGFVKIVGHQESIGQPALFGTTSQFLEVFGLSSLGELPTLRDLHQLEVHEGQDEDQEEEVVHEDVCQPSA
ncbi:SMC-Scp complex subunit ScpB [bacterium]|nr:SMC-Scp complex subunit ScpB [bacterium]